VIRVPFLDHIEACNRHDPANLTPFRVAGRVLGWLGPRVADALAARPRDFVRAADGIALDPRYADFSSRSKVLDDTARFLFESGIISRLTGEPYVGCEGWGREALFRLDRGSAEAFGLLAFGVHLIGHIAGSGDPPDLWVAYRSKTKPTYPGMLDNTVAGGQPDGLSLEENLLKECAEEAGIGAGLASRARPVGALTYCMATREGLKRDVLFCYDLELPADVTPRPHDGEIERFERWPAERLARTVEETAAFKFNCHLVAIHWLVRRGVIGPDHPDYPSLVSGLHRPPWPRGR
jgi:isopentenyldiphosphate isomerase